MFAVTALESDLLSSLNLGSTAVFRLGSLGVLVSSVNTVHLVWVSRTSSNMEVQDHYKVLGTTIGATTSKNAIYQSQRLGKYMVLYYYLHMGV